MSVPSAPATKALADGLATVGGYVKTSKYKFADWNLKAPSPTTKLPDSEFIKLSRAAQFFREGHFTTEDIKKVQDTAKEAKTKVKETEKLAKESKNLWDKFLSKVKGGGNLDKASQAGGTVAKSAATLLSLAPLLAALAAIGLSVAVNKVQGWRNDINEEGQQKLSDSISKVLGLMNAQKQRIDRANEGVKKAELENQRVKDRVYSLEKQQPTIRESAADAKKKANDALYEVREGRKAVEAKITTADKKANDALYEVREGRKAVEAKITTADKKANDALYETRTGRVKLENEISGIKTKVGTVENKLKIVESSKSSFDQKILQATQDTIKTVSSKVDKTTNDLAKTITDLASLKLLPPRVATLEGKVQTIETEHPKRWGVAITQSETRQATVTKSTDTATRGYIDRVLASLTGSQFSAAQWVERYGVKTANLVDNGVDTLRKADETLANKLSDTDRRIGIIENKAVPADPEVGRLSKEVTSLKNDLDSSKNKLLETNKNLENLKTQTNEQEKVNKEGNSKLDTILGILPLIPARAASAIKPDIPTIPQIETASATGTCRTLQPGGCSSKAFDNLGNSVNQNTNNQSSNLFDKLNAGANTVQLGLLKTIDSKLGNQIPGGISGKLVAGFNWLRLDRALSVLTFAATIQNHVMLSSNIAETLFGAFENILKIFGFKDDQGEPFSLNSSIQDLVKGIVGESNYAVISQTWAKANRIYQATSNVLNSFQSLSNTILSGMELIAGNNAKIGNALRKGGAVLENAYGWMNPQPKMNRTTQILENLNQGASTIQQVTQVPLDVVNAVTELQNANTEFVKALKDDDKPENKSIQLPEPDKLKQTEAANKAVSGGKNLTDADKEEDA